MRPSYHAHWAEAAKKALLVQPSSAASEWLFSLLNNTFGKRQNSSLEDYVESGIMLQYNYHFYVGILFLGIKLGIIGLKSWHCQKA